MSGEYKAKRHAEIRIPQNSSFSSMSWNDNSARSALAEIAYLDHEIETCRDSRFRYWLLELRERWLRLRCDQ